MSGSGGGGGNDWRPEPKLPKRPAGGDSGTSPDQQRDPCAIAETTNLNSVDANVLAKVKVGEVLLVKFLPGPPRRLVAQTPDGETVGSITSPSMPQFITCIEQAGREYVAEVLSVRGALCQVEVHPA